MPAMYTLLHAGWRCLWTSGVACLPACMALLLAASPVFAVETAPRISDREIVEGLTEIRGDIKRLEARLEGDIKRLEGDIKRLEAGQTQLRTEMTRRIDDLRADTNHRFEELRADINRRFDTLQWMFGLFITVTLAVLAAIARNLWMLNRAQAAQEKMNESLKAEIASLKESDRRLMDTDLKLMDQIKALIEILKPPKGAL
ncbi:MAG: hypothetical protein HZA21_02400 [Nitrospirae bacterium]|nr:hypothetical protein [Nitrospirota bacterium]